MEKKGIGRFATARISEELELYTRTEKQINTESIAIFDWTQFENDEIFLQDIIFLAEEQEANIITKDWKFKDYTNKVSDTSFHGTVLRMKNLKHNWGKHDLEILQRGLSRLISPFYKKNDFNIFLELPEKHKEFNTKISPPEIINYPHYTVKGKVSKKGEYSFSVQVEGSESVNNFNGFFYKSFTEGEWNLFSSSDKLDIDAESIIEKKIESGPFIFELRIWDRDKLENVNQKIGGGIRSIRKDLDAIAGINIYRDEFRVLPYGEPDNDWLRLDLRRVQNPTKRLSNNQITGYIVITADNNPGLHDRSNREGLDNNAPFFDLQNIMKYILNEIEAIRYVKRRKKPQEPDDKNQLGLFTTPDFKEITNAINNDKTNKKETIKLINQAESNWKDQIKKFQKVLSQYHALATLGGIVDKVLHDGRQPLASIQTEAGLGKELVEDLVDTNLKIPELNNLETGFKKIIDQSTILRDVFRRVEPFGGRRKGSLKKYFIEDLIHDIFQIYEKELSDNQIKTDLPTSETLVSIDRTELSEIFTNFITNSLYWLKSVSKKRRNIRVSVERKLDKSIEIIFADSGPGIDPKHKDYIFDPYFSRKPEGHGLGLCLVGEIVSDYYNGEVELLDSGKEGGAIFRITMRKRV